MSCLHMRQHQNIEVGCHMKLQISEDGNSAKLNQLYLPDPFFILLILVGFGVPLLTMCIPDFAEAGQQLHYILWPPLIGLFGIFLWISKGFFHLKLSKEKLEIRRGLKSWNLPTNSITDAYIEHGEIHQKRSGVFPYFRLIVDVSLPDDSKQNIEDGSFILLERDYESYDKRDKHAEQLEPVVAHTKSMINS